MKISYPPPLKPDLKYETSGSTFIFDPKFDVSKWSEQQSKSVERYQDSSYEDDETLGVLFGGFIACNLERSGLVLDIGCGLHSELPHYVKHLDLLDYLGIEPITAPVARTYTCLSGVMAEDIPLQTDCAESAIFATSLDHIKDATAAISEVVRVLKPGAPLYFWLGVHDPYLLAEAKSFGVVHNHSAGLRKFLRIAGAPVEHIHLILKMRKQAQRLAAGIPLDTAHVRYHTLATIDDELGSYGLDIIRRVLVPGSASLFVEARVTGGLATQTVI
jgi:SAM-dependent methyltransferase